MIGRQGPMNIFDGGRYNEAVQKPTVNVIRKPVPIRGNLCVEQVPGVFWNWNATMEVVKRGKSHSAAPSLCGHLPIAWNISDSINELISEQKPVNRWVKPKLSTMTPRSRVPERCSLVGVDHRVSIVLENEICSSVPCGAGRIPDRLSIRLADDKAAIFLHNCFHIPPFDDVINHMYKAMEALIPNAFGFVSDYIEHYTTEELIFIDEKLEGKEFEVFGYDRTTGILRLDSNEHSTTFNINEGDHEQISETTNNQ